MKWKEKWFVIKKKGLGNKIVEGKNGENGVEG